MKGLLTTLKFSNLEEINPLFSRATVQIAYTDLNRNNSDISESAFEDAVSTIYGTPIVGEFVDTKQNFGDHGGEIQYKDGEPIYVDTTVPYGFIPESAKIYWEEVEEKNGEVHKYLFADGAILWTGRYTELEMLIGKKFNQSMEIVPVEEEWVEIDGKKVHKINKFYFSAFCILGTDYNKTQSANHVEPCFESASITTYSLNKNNCKDDIDLMLKEYKNSEINFAEKNNNEFVITDNYLSGEVEQVPKSKNEIAVLFKLTVNQMQEELSRILNKVTYVGQNWYGDACEKQRYYLQDYDESFVYVFDTKENYMNMKIPYSVQGDNPEIQFENASRIKYTPTDWENTNSTANNDLSSDEVSTFSYLQFLEADAKSEISTLASSYKEKENEYKNKISEFEAKIQDNQEVVFAINKKYEDANKENDDLKNRIAELESFKADKLNSEKNEKVEALIVDNSKYFSVDEIEEWRTKGKDIESYDAFEKEFKSIAFNKIKSTISEDKVEKRHVFIEKSEDEVNDDSDVFSKLKNKLSK